MSMDWVKDSACADEATALFFIKKPSGRPSLAYEKKVAQVKAICAGCPVRRECGDYAATNNVIDGIWGGLTEDERKEATGNRPRAFNKPEGPATCGTDRGYRTHLKNSEPACDPCKKAHRAMNTRNERKQAVA